MFNVRGGFKWWNTAISNIFRTTLFSEKQDGQMPETGNGYTQILKDSVPYRTQSEKLENSLVPECGEISTDLRVDEGGGMKADIDKSRWDLLDWDFLEEVSDVMTFGAKKYDDYNWQKCYEARLFAAMMRHIRAHDKGETIDPESGKTHLAHACCGLMFLYWKRKERDGSTI